MDGLKQEITILQQELANLQQQHKLLEKSVDEETKCDFKPNHNDDVPIVHHSYFDESISKYFDIKPTSFNVGSAMDDYNKIIALKENILYENLYRLIGITAFPLNRVFDPESHFLGIRFDIFSDVHKLFNTIHYVILRLTKPATDAKTLQNTPNSLRYSVYKATCFIPEHISSQLQFDNPTKEVVVLFTKHLRKELIQHQLQIDLEWFINDLKFNDVDIGIDGQVFKSIVKYDNIFSISNSEYLIDIAIDDGIVIKKIDSFCDYDVDCLIILKQYELLEFMVVFTKYIQSLYSIK